MSLKRDLENIIDKDNDFVCIIKLMNSNTFEEEILGNNSNCENMIL